MKHVGFSPISKLYAFAEGSFAEGLSTLQAQFSTPGRLAVVPSEPQRSAPPEAERLGGCGFTDPNESAG